MSDEKAKSGLSIRVEGEEPIYFDACISETHSSSSKITEAPLENGESIVDHKALQADTLRVEALVSDHFFNSTEKKGWTYQGDRSSNFYDRLLALHESRQKVTVRTSLRTYTDAILESFEVPREMGTRDSCKVTMSFRMVRFAESATVERPGDKAKGSKKRGHVASKNFKGKTK